MPQPHRQRFRPTSVLRTFAGAHRRLVPGTLLAVACLLPVTAGAQPTPGDSTPETTPVPAAPLLLSADAERLDLNQGLAVSSVAEVTRRPINTDAVIAAMAAGTLDLSTIKAGDALAPERAWADVSAGEQGFAPVGRATYVLVRVRAERARVMMLDASGHAMVYANGEPRMGDPYAHGYVTLPVSLREGENTLLFAHAGRGPMRAALRTPPADVFILGSDLTLPDARPGEAIDSFIGVPVVNASDRTRSVVITADAGAGVFQSDTITLRPGAVLKASAGLKVAAADSPVALKLAVLEGDAVLSRHEATLASPPAGATHKLTYLSRVDFSTQYISVVPPPGSEDRSPPGLVLSLHGASVEATSQAASYAPRPGYVIACPTNRRPFGFDWEDWGRIDAIESMDLIKSRFRTDPSRQYLTGHSMGGHGTWNLGVLYPERFAAIAPSAGWLSFDSYSSKGGPEYAPAGALGDVFRAGRAPSNTEGYLANLRGKGIYILHGDADDNVPVEQARTARTLLGELGIPHAFHEQPGAGHWWDDDQPGAACLDWPGIWETFAAHRLGAKPASPEVRPPVDARGFAADTFKRAFDFGFVLVYSTGGTPEENAWSRAKARFDADQWWYRGNGRAPVLADAEFIERPTDGNVILYGHAQSNLAWATTIGAGSGLVLERGKAGAGGYEAIGDDVGVLAVVQRADRGGRSVGVVGGTGLAGMRATDRLGYFGSGIGFPDVTIVRSGIWRDGYAAVEFAGSLTKGVSRATDGTQK